MKIKEHRYVVLGGGISGCAAAWMLNALGAAEVCIVEQDQDCGGLSKTLYLNGRPYEIGPHIMHAVKPSTIHLYQKYGVRLIDYYTKMVYDNRLDMLVDFPFSLDTIFQLPREVAKQVVAELYKINSEKSDQANLSTYLRSVCGDTLYDAFNHGYSSKFWGKEPSAMPSNAAASWINFRTIDKRLFPEWQGYPQGDFNSFFKWMTKGIKVVSGRVLGIGEVKRGAMTSITTDRGKVEGDYFISTIPPGDLFTNIREKLLYIGKILVVTQLEKGPLFPRGIGGIYFPDKFKFNRVVEYPAINDNNYPALNEGTILGFEYPYFSGSKSADLQEHIDDAAATAVQLWNARVVASAASQYHSVYPVRDKEQLKKYEKYQKRAKKIKNLLLTGCLGSFKYLNMNDCIELVAADLAGVLKMNADSLLKEVGLL